MKKKCWAVSKILLVCALLGGAAFWLLQKSPSQKAFEQNLAQAQQGNAPAQMQIAAAYLMGNPIPKDISQAVNWYLRAAAQGYAPAAYELGQLYLAGEDVERDIPSGISYLKLAAEKEFAPAQYALGRLYQTGAEGLPEKLGQAAFLWMQAAKQGNEDAQAALDTLKAENPELFAQVTTLFEKTEKISKEPDGQTLMELAQAYAKGDILEQNAPLALSLYQQAAAQGNAAAPYELYLLYLQTDGPVAQDEEKALTYLEQAAGGGFAPAQYDVGNRIYHVAQTPQEYQIAYHWFEQAAGKNHPGALYMCGIMRMQGQGIEKNVSEGLSLFTQAANLGNTDAQYVLGQSYLRGLGTAKNKKEAEKWLTLAAQSGHAQAAALLAEIH